MLCDDVCLLVPHIQDHIRTESESVCLPTWIDQTAARTCYESLFEVLYCHAILSHDDMCLLCIHADIALHAFLLVRKAFWGLVQTAILALLQLWLVKLGHLFVSYLEIANLCGCFARLPA